jgi:hypothetical protein
MEILVLGNGSQGRMIRPKRLPMHLTDLIDVSLIEIEWVDLSPLEIARLKRIEERRASKIKLGLPVRKVKLQHSRIVRKVK